MMRGSRALLLICGAAITSIVALGTGGAAVSPVAAAPGTSAAAAARPIPFAIGHVLAAGHMSQPTTTAQCETNLRHRLLRALPAPAGLQPGPAVLQGDRGPGRDDRHRRCLRLPVHRLGPADLRLGDGPAQPALLPGDHPRGPDHHQPLELHVHLTARPALICARTTTAGPTRRASTSSGRT